MRRAALSFVLMIVAVAAAAAQDTRKWMFDDTADGVVLQYGMPESDDLVITFACEREPKQMRISEFIGSDSLVPGSAATLRLTSGTQTVSYTGQATSNEESGTVNIEITTPIDRKLFALLKTGPTLIVELPGKQETIPLKAGTPQVAQFEKACLSKR